MTAAKRSPTADRRGIAPIREFRRIADAWLEETCRRYPEYGSSLGLRDFEGKLSTNSAVEHRAQNALVRKTLASVEALPEAEFTGDDYLDRRAFLAMLRTQEVFDIRLERWRTNPQQSIESAINAIFELLVRYPNDLRRVLPSVESRLEAIPGFLEAGARNLRRPVPLWTELAVKTCVGSGEFLENLRDVFGPVSMDPKRTIALLQKASAAIRRFAVVIQKKEPGRSGDFAVGREMFELLLRERLGFDQSLPEMEANGWALVHQLEREIREEAKRTGFRSADQALAAARDQWNPQRPLLDLYREVTAEIKARLTSLDLVTMPTGESLDVLPVPPFLRNQFPTAAYQQAPPFSKRQTGIFWVNDLSLLQQDSSKKLAEIRQHYGLEFTSAHEAYPGHHLQFSIQNRHPSKLRRLFAHSIFYEGWTLWCEKMCVEQGIVPLPGARLIQMHDALWRAYRIVIDCGLHSGKLSYDAACRLLMKGVGFTKARAQGDVNWYTSSPTVPMSYLLGRLEVERLHARFVGVEGWSLKEFNDWMLSHGAVPWRWIMEARLRGPGVPRK